MATINYGELGSITQKYFYPKLVDNIFTSNPLLMRARKKWLTLIDGGTQLVAPVAYATTTAAGWYNGGSDTLSVTANDQIDSAVLDWAFAYANITIARKDELINSGKAAIVNFVKAKVQLAEKTLADTLGTGLYNLGTTANALIGLRLAVGTGRTYASINSSTYSWWNAQVDSTTTVLTIPAMQTLWGQCVIGNDKPTIVVGTQATQNDYYSLLQPQQRFQDEETAKGGFTNLMYNGVPFVVDNHVPAGYLFMLNEDYLHLMVMADENFRFEPFQKPINQNASSAKIYFAGQLILNNPRMCGSFTAIA
jgi:hypothetical protein